MLRERPILFTSENAQKIFDGEKTQTRRIVKPQPLHMSWFEHQQGWCARVREDMGSAEHPAYVMVPCPYGVVGDRIWVRENGWERPERTPKMMRDGADTWERFYYDALLDSGERDELKGYGFKRRPSIHMPRWACRTVLEITDVRVERLGSISEADAQAEGVQDIAEFIKLWESINQTWEPSKWVWVLEFRKVLR